MPRPARRCAVTSREIRPGEPIVSVLFIAAGQLQRRDVALEAWQKPPDAVLGFWKTRMPALPNAANGPAAPETLATLIERFEQTAQPSAPEALSERYQLALDLLDKKALKLLDVERTGDRDVLLLGRPRSNAVYRVPEPPQNATSTNHEVNEK